MENPKNNNIILAFSILLIQRKEQILLFVFLNTKSLDKMKQLLAMVLTGTHISEGSLN
jgi:hypothetical protein